VTDAEEVIDDFEARGFAWVVYRGDVTDLCVFGGGVEFEEREDGDDGRGRDVD
jgi:hypothetical protein